MDRLDSSQIIVCYGGRAIVLSKLEGKCCKAIIKTIPCQIKHSRDYIGLTSTLVDEDQNIKVTDVQGAFRARRDLTYGWAP